MIVRKQPAFRDILFAVRGSILPHIARRLLAIALVGVAAVLAAAEWPGIFARISAIPFTLIGIALSVFMSFRSNACCARWWEGRQLWGELIIACRSFAREISLLDARGRRVLLRGLCGFTAGLGARLRGGDEPAAIAPWCDIGADASGPIRPTRYSGASARVAWSGRTRGRSMQSTTRSWRASSPAWPMSRAAASASC